MQDPLSSLNDVEKQLQVRNRILESLLEIGRAVSAELQMEPLCDLVVSRLAEVLEAEDVTLFFRDENTGELHDERTFLGQELIGDEVARKRAAQAALASQHVVCGTEGKKRRVGKSFSRTDQFSLVAVPLKADETDRCCKTPGTMAAVSLKAENKIKGVITITWPSTAQRPTEDDLRMLDVLAAQIAPAIDNAWLYGQLEALNAGLEEKVQKRTRELAASNAELCHTIEELKQAQAQLVQSEKMASLGQLTAGVAHEINNPLAFAVTNTAVARERLERLRLLCRLLATVADALACTKPEERKQVALRFIDSLRNDPVYREDVLAFEADLTGMPEEEQAALCLEFLRYVRTREEQTSNLDQIADSIGNLLVRSEEGLQRVKEIVLDLRSFSRLDEAQFLEADIDGGIASTLSIIAHLAKDRCISLTHQRGLSDPYPCFPAKLNQVVLNFVTNALQATDAGGSVTIRTWNDSNGVFIEVADTGSGIAAEHISRVFDPFFTTKPVGQGTGLGLSISYKIVEEHNGTIRLWSRPGEGARFTICLPPRSE